MLLATASSTPLIQTAEGRYRAGGIGAHIRLVSGSGRTREIRALKIWRERNRLDFPSFYLELTVMESLRAQVSKSARPGAPNLVVSVQRVFEYLCDEFLTARVVDPANSNNVVSEDLRVEERRVIAVAARRALERIGGAAAFPQGLKPSSLLPFTARLKPCPPANPENPATFGSSGWEQVLW